MGDTPSLWVKLKTIRVDYSSWTSPPLQQLNDVLSSTKIQNLNLTCSSDHCLGLIRMIAQDHPQIRKLSLQTKWIDVLWEVYKDFAKTIVKFEEVDLAYSDFMIKCHNIQIDEDGLETIIAGFNYPDMAGDLRKVLLSEAGRQKDSKLRTITFCGESIEELEDDQYTFFNYPVIHNFGKGRDVEVKLEYRVPRWIEASSSEPEEGLISSEESESED